ncbi:hypothetical protein JCM5350_003634 [Sporobolomyces pararoseus]
MLKMPTGFSTILPADSNPYLNLNGAYKSQLILKHPRSANTQLFCLSIIHGITILFLLTSLIINWWKARFWLIRRRAATPLLVLNFPVVGAIVAIALITIFEVTLARSIQTFDGWLQKDYGFWLLFSGSTRHVIAEIVIWTLTASTIIRNQIKGSQLKFWSYMCNIIGIATPLLTIIAALVLAVLGGIRYSTAVGAYDKLNAFFIEESLTWSSTNLTNRFIPPPRELVDNFETNLEGIEKWWRMSFLFSGIIGAVLTAAVIVVAVLYLFSLRKNVVKMGQTLDAPAVTRAEVSQPQLKTTWTILLGVLVTVILFSSMTLALEFYIYVRPFSFHSRTISAALLFIPFYLSSFPGLAFSIALLFNATKAQSSSKDAEKGWKTVFVRRWMMYKKRNDMNRSAVSSASLPGGGGASAASRGETESVDQEKTIVVSVEDGEMEKKGSDSEDAEVEESVEEVEVKIESADPAVEIEKDEVAEEEEEKEKEKDEETDGKEPEVEVVVS